MLSHRRLPAWAALQLLLCPMPAWAAPTWNTYGPPKSANLERAPAVLSYAVTTGELGLEDSHSCVAVSVAKEPGAVILAGVGLECADDCQTGQSKTHSDGMAVKMNRDGTLAWGWRSNRNGANDHMLGVTELPSGEILLAGYLVDGGVGRRALIKLSSAGQKIWEFTDFGGDDASHHGAIELVTMAGTTDVLLAGLKDLPSLDGMGFKSGGNCEFGKAWIAKMPVDKLTKTTPPTRGDISWEKTEATYMTAKAAKALPDGSVVALMWAGEQNGVAAMSAGIARYTADGLTTTWGPKNFGNEQKLEGTDIAFTTDGSKIAMSGHGSFLATDKDYSGKRVIISAADGAVLSNTEISAGGVPEMIYNECWGVAAVSDGFVVSCGTGIEGCGHVSDTNKAACLAGQGDPSTPNMKFGASLWQSMAAKIDLSGTLLWRRVDAYRGGQAACVECTSFTAGGTSASEWVIANADGTLAFVNDEADGFGVMVLNATGGSGGGTSPPKKNSGSLSRVNIVVAAWWVVALLWCLTVN